MKASTKLRLVSGVRDLQIVDCDECNCGIVDDIELQGTPGSVLKVKALLVGPGAYTGRLPRWAMKLVRLFAGAELVKVPWDEVDSINSAVKLRSRAKDLGLASNEERARRLLPEIGGL